MTAVRDGVVVGEAVAVGLAVGVRVAVAVTVGEAAVVGRGVGVAGAVAVAVGETVGGDVGVGVTVAGAVAVGVGVSSSSSPQALSSGTAIMRSTSRATRKTGFLFIANLLSRIFVMLGLYEVSLDLIISLPGIAVSLFYPTSYE